MEEKLQCADPTDTRLLRFCPFGSACAPPEGVLDKGVLGRPACYPWAKLMGCEDMKAEDCTYVRIGLSMAWKASLATDYEDSFLCNRLYVNPRPPGVYINRRG